MKAILTLLAVGSSVGLGWGVYRYSIQAAQENLTAPAKPAVSVEVMVSNRRPMEDRAQLVGSLTAGSLMQVLAPRNGYIMKLPYDVGDPVEKGQVIVELDDREQQELLSGAKAAFVVAQAQKKAAGAQEQLAQNDLTRQKRLTERSASTQQALETAQAQYDIAVAQRELEEARVKQAEAEVSRHQLTVDDSKILATQDGFIGERLKEVGDLAKPDVPLLTIVSFETVRTVVHVVEKDYPRVQVGQDATIHVDAFPDMEFKGQVIRKAPILNPNTRTAAVQIEIPNPKGLLKPGMHADVLLVFERRDAVVLPVAALLDSAERPTVLIVENDPPTIRVQEVTVGINDGEFVEILSGITHEDQIVTMGNRLVKSGQVVDPVNIPWPTPAETKLAQDLPPARGEASGSGE